MSEDQRYWGSAMRRRIGREEPAAGRRGRSGWTVALVARRLRKQIGWSAGQKR